MREVLEVEVVFDLWGRIQGAADTLRRYIGLVKRGLVKREL